MKIFQSILLLILLLSFISASCSSGKIDINTASLIELDKLTGIGPVYAQAIIDSRPFSSVDNLIDVKGIGPTTLEKIKSQGLACVEDEVTSNEISTKTEDSLTVQEQTKEVSSDSKETTQKKITSTINAETITSEPSESIINLNNAQQEETIVYESKGEKVNKYLLTGFCVFLIGIIFLLIRK